jgi:hypothetical protein
MNNNYRPLKPQFGPDVRFEVPAAPFRAALTSELEQLKNRLLRQALQGNADVGQNLLLRRAANEAAALVWLTPYPLLLLPELLEEKARAARLQNGRQRQIRRRSQTLALEAA